MTHKKYILEELDCAQCANKIERRIQQMDHVDEASVNFVNKQLMVKVSDGFRETEMISLIHDLEPEVNVKEVTSHKHDHEECACHHGHEHDEACGCGHHHEEHHEHVIEKAHQYAIVNLDCANCAAKIEAEIKRLDQVEDASIAFATGMIAIRYKDESQASVVLEKIQALIDTIEPGVKIQTTQNKEEKNNHHVAEWLRLLVAFIFFVLGLLFQSSDYALILFLISFVISGGKVVWKALSNLMHKELFDENFLMSIATIGAFGIGEYAEGVAVMLFYEVGELFQSIAVNRSRQNIAQLMDIRSDHANLLIDGVEQVVAPEDVNIGDILRLKPGERVALDGVLLSESASMDTSALSGESLPRELTMGNEILAGSVNLSKVVEMKVTHTVQESCVARILELVQNASSRKAPMEQFITKFARYYTPSVVLGAILVALLPPLFMQGSFDVWLYRALTFLVVSCPCALVVSIPLGMFAGIGGASRKGILVKGGNYLEALKDIDTVVFDKTGTLTKGVFKVQEIIADDPEKVLKLAAYGESFSSHPIAQSIVEAYGKAIDQTQITSYEELSGHGILCVMDDQEVLLGNEKLMKQYHIETSNQTNLGTIVYVACNQELIGTIFIADELKENSVAAIAALRAAGVRRSIMLSGDRKSTVLQIKDQLHLDEAYGELLPQDKVAKVEALLETMPEHKKLAFVGDGINDAPVIARADIGFAMGGIGSDAAIEAADVVLMKDDPLAISEAIRISHKTKKILYQNIIGSLGIKAVVLVLSATGNATMWMGVFADVGVTLLAVLNSMRALKA